ncbi:MULTISPECIES: hypothetical protein [Pontibacillus]|uniref:Uncharacterized protein n=1 Tax=Pontibacillus chungwhensis TaxID=265426 RepID=A0ABY8V3I1_9BACI|nr:MULTISPECIES: hypothetical protein [Pontibacillus]MCD5326132.1 hypothetical protein [Pontibacillus sp. HN14]WIG00310.1 hypothetical protein QNI29_20905 [Pontibacillus chungwhensis]
MGSRYLMYFYYGEGVESTIIEGNYNPMDKMDELEKSGKTFEYRGEDILFSKVISVTEL